MPELPEVETVRAGLAAHVLGRRIADVAVLRDYSIRHQRGGVSELADFVTNTTITEVARRGKFMWLVLDRGVATGGQDPAFAVLVHLGMSGQLRINDIDTSASAHTRVRLALTTGSQRDEPVLLDFVDQRTFGYIAAVPLVPTEDGRAGGVGTAAALVPDRAAHIARDLLDPALDLDQTVQNIRAKRSAIKRVLLDQRVVAGVGNIYADEALWRARLHGERSANTLSRAKVLEVLQSAQDVMADALEQGGTSFDSLYVNVNGESGYFSRSLAVYGRVGRPCLNCQTPIARAAFANRSSHYCPRCQRKHR